MNNKGIKAIGLISGGLDSALACCIMKREGIEVIGLHCSTGFCITEHKRRIKREKDLKKDLRNPALAVASNIGIPIEIADISTEYLQIVLNPKYGYGSAINPCIDCRILMIKIAKEYSAKYDAKFIFTGEVLGQRPMSQHKYTLRLIEKESGCQGYLLRPLSAKLLEETVPEKMGWVNRNNLYDIKGRSRKIQLQLAKEFGIRDYSPPAGGCCFLVDINYARRFQDLVKHIGKEKIDMEKLNLLKLGRHFRINANLKIIVGREEKENKLLEQYADNRSLFKCLNYPGAVAITEGNVDEESEKIIASIAAYYSDGRKQKEVEVIHINKEGEKIIRINPAKEQELNRWRI